ncbi:MAG: nucleotide exchange factor GrpE [Rikenellaceae bacterium]|nr:nucleotide exchange factor GrpE [Rikenellaceae bacterium]
MISHDDQTKQTDNPQFTDSKMENGGTGGKDAECPASDNLSEEGEAASDNQSEGFVPPTPQEEAAAWKEKYMRLSAEFDNFRKRTLKEKMELAEYGGEGVIKSLLPVLDDMDRAIDSMYRTEDVASVRSGIELIRTKLTDTLRGQGLSEIKAVGEKLDTDYHEAVAKCPAPDTKQKGCIVDVAQKGYNLKNKVIRHAKVVVGE